VRPILRRLRDLVSLPARSAQAADELRLLLGVLLSQ